MLQGFDIDGNPVYFDPSDPSRGADKRAKLAYDRNGDPIDPSKQGGDDGLAGMLDVGFHIPTSGEDGVTMTFGGSNDNVLSMQNLLKNFFEQPEDSQKKILK